MADPRSGQWLFLDKKHFQPRSQHKEGYEQWAQGCEEHREPLSTAASGSVQFLDLLKDQEHTTAHFLFMWDTQLMKLHRHKHKTWKLCQRLCHSCSPPCVGISQANLHFCRMRWGWREQSPSPHTAEAHCPLTCDGSRVSTSFPTNLQASTSSSPARPSPCSPEPGICIPRAGTCHSKKQKFSFFPSFPQPFPFFFKTTSMLGHSFFSSVFNFRENLCLILCLGALNMDV